MSFSRRILASLAALLALYAAVPAASVASPDVEDTKTVLGPRNAPLADGAAALMARDAEKGVELTLKGLEMAQGRRERQAALSNLCAGYVLLDDTDSALKYCNLAIAENENNWRAYNNRALVHLRLGQHEQAEADVALGQALSPRSRNLKEVKGLILDETEPVVPTITVDDRRDPSAPLEPTADEDNE